MRTSKIARLRLIRGEVFDDIAGGTFKTAAAKHAVSVTTLDDLVQEFSTDYAATVARFGLKGKRKPRKSKPSGVTMKPGKRHRPAKKKIGDTVVAVAVSGEQLQGVEAPCLQAPQALAEVLNPEPLPREEWPTDLAGLRRLIPEAVHPAADDLDLWPVAKLHAGAEQLACTKHLVDRIKRLESTGEILDGRNRRILCALSGVRPEFEDVGLPPGMTPKDYVLEINVFRRQLTCDQLAAHAALRYSELRDLGKLRRTANLQQGRQSPEVEKIPHRGSSLDFLARLFGVNPRYIQDATTIREHDPDLFLRLKDGKVSMVDARRACGLTQRRVKKPAVEGNGGGEVDLRTSAGTPGCATGANGAASNTAERSRLLSLARAVEEACRQVPDVLKSQFDDILRMARQAIMDFDLKNNAPPQEP